MESRPRILVIDDEPDMVDMLRMALEKASYEVIAAYDGREGVEKARTEKPDAIVLDIMMPEKDGFVACRELKGDAATADIPILILTAVGSRFATTSYARSMGLDLEADDYIDKPVDPNELVKRVGKLLARANSPSRS